MTRRNMLLAGLLVLGGLGLGWAGFGQNVAGMGMIGGPDKSGIMFETLRDGPNTGPRSGAGGEATVADR